MTKSLKIFIADDESLIRLDLKEMLEEYGYQVVGQAKDGLEVVEFVPKLNPDLIILDIKMPNMTGLEALAQINKEENKKRIPVIMLTAFSDKELVEQAVELGVFAYLVKPIKETDLIPAIKVAISRSNEMQAIQKQVGKLKEALEVRKLVEKAKGILMEKYKLTESQAFRRIQKTSMDTRKTMKDIAEAIIITEKISEN